MNAGRLGPGVEFDMLRAIFARVGTTGQGLGDDTALMRLGATTLAISIDLSLEGVHFRTAWMSFEEIGWRAAAAAFSDLAAEGAKPFGVLVSLGIPGGQGNRGRGRGDEATEIMAGVAAAARHVGAKVLGGDLVRSPRYIVDVCVLGTAVRPVRRSGARAGDGVWVTGVLGGAALALRQFRSGTPPGGILRRRFARPRPRIAAGRWLARHGARAMIDISDGLVSDARQLAAASGIAIKLELERLPCWPGAAPRDASASGEEYELLVALPRAFGERQARAFARANGIALTFIGRCAVGSGVRLAQAGRAVPARGGFDHFAVR